MNHSYRIQDIVSTKDKRKWRIILYINDQKIYDKKYYSYRSYVDNMRHIQYILDMSTRLWIMKYTNRYLKYLWCDRYHL